MAEAIRKQAPPPPPDAITIQLSEREASILMDVLLDSRVHYDFCQELCKQLDDLGVEKDGMS